MITIRREALRNASPNGAVIDADASEAGLPAGEWPMDIKVPDRFGRLITFERLRVVKRYGEIEMVTYTARVGAFTVLLRIYND